METNDPGNPMLYASFNQSVSRICVGTKTGFLIYSIDPFKRLYKSENGGCCIVEILEDTSLVATVGAGDTANNSRRTVKLYDMSIGGKTKELCRLPFETPVLAIKMNKKRLVVILEAEINIYNIENVSFLTKINTNPNPKGLSAMSHVSSGTHPMLLAYPSTSGSLKGDLVLYDPISLSNYRKLSDMHNHPLQSIHLSQDGRLVATASEAGTLIKILPVLEREQERYTFRRGMVQSADISSIAFNKSSTLLAVSSTNGTVHIFDVKDGLEKISQPKSTIGMLGDFLWGEETRSFTTVKLAPGMNNLVAFSGDSSRVYTITQDGKYSQWQLATSRISGWTSTASICKLVREDNLLRDYYYIGDDEEHTDTDTTFNEPR